jgi:hypothetical protein
LDDAARIVGNAGIVAQDNFELSASDRVAILLNVKLDRRSQLPPDGVESGPCHGKTDPHFENFLSISGTGENAKNCAAGSHSFEHCPSQHCVPSSSTADGRRRKPGLPRDQADFLRRGHALCSS